MRVAAYEKLQRLVGSIHEIMGDGVVKVQYGSISLVYHPAQLRLLRPKAKAREWWIVVSDLGGVRAFHSERGAIRCLANLKGASIVHVKEVLK
jgi:hypothetical protein